MPRLERLEHALAAYAAAYAAARATSHRRRFSRSCFGRGEALGCERVVDNLLEHRDSAQRRLVLLRLLAGLGGTLPGCAADGDLVRVGSLLLAREGAEDEYVELGGKVLGDHLVRATEHELVDDGNEGARCGAPALNLGVARLKVARLLDRLAIFGLELLLRAEPVRDAKVEQCEELLETILDGCTGDHQAHLCGQSEQRLKEGRLEILEFVRLVAHEQTKRDRAQRLDVQPRRVVREDEQTRRAQRSEAHELRLDVILHVAR